MTFFELASHVMLRNVFYKYIHKKMKIYMKNVDIHNLRHPTNNI